jgi:transcription initiation factor TFIIH subunit 1
VKVIRASPDASGRDNYVFTFTSATRARAEQGLVVDALKELIASRKAANTPSSTAAVGTSARSPAQANGNAKPANDWLSDASLLADVSLQRSLLSENARLQRRLDESLKTKPDVITLAQFSSQFWAARIHLLRAHAVNKSQQQGPYNSLSEVKLNRNAEGKLTLKLSQEHIHLIFNQHPLVRKVYDDMVPAKLTEQDFWQSFFVSKLFKKLKGEPITDMDASHPELDKYLNVDESGNAGRQFTATSIPRFLDLEGNEQDHVETKGNAESEWMKPPSRDKAQILRTLNTMSEKLLANVSAVDEEHDYGRDGSKDDGFVEFKLHDLEETDHDNRIRLNISSQQHFVPHAPPEKQEAGLVPPGTIISNVLEDTSTDQSLLIPPDEISKQQASVSFANVMNSVKQRASLLTTTKQDTNLSQAAMDTATMTHNTTIEFLHYFWSVYLSGDESRAGELQTLAETLERSLDRMNAAAAEAEAEKEKNLDQIRRKQEDAFRRTGRRLRISASKAGGGAKAVRTMLSATEKAVRFAEGEYQATYREQVAQGQ